jgi:hypothetical protein
MKWRLASPLQAPKTPSAFHPPHDETLSAAMRVNNPDRVPIGINGWDIAQTPTAFLDITGDDFPVFHAIRAHHR